MKNIIIGCIGMLCVTFTGCTNVKKMTRNPLPKVSTQQPYILAGKGENLCLDLEIEIPKEYTNMNTGIIVTPVIAGTNGAMYECPDYVVEGYMHRLFNERQTALAKKKADNIDKNHRRNRRKGNNIQYVCNVPFQPWMTNAQIYVKFRGNAYLKNQALGEANVQCGINSLSHLIETDYAKFLVCNSLNSQTFTPIYFDHNSDVVKACGRGREIRERVNEITKDNASFSPVYSLLISTSPEATFQYNEQLAKRRLEQTATYLYEHGVDVNMENCTFDIQGWNKMIALLRESNHADAEGIAQIINEENNLDKRLSVIKKRFPHTYSHIVKDIYPKLRYAQVTMHNQAETTPSELSQLVASKKYSEALRCAEQFKNSECNQETLFTKAILYALNNQEEEAIPLLKALLPMKEAEYILGTIYLKNNNITKANKYLENHMRMNSAIVKVYRGENSDAMDILKYIDKNNSVNELISIINGIINNQDIAIKF
ncbi:MAG: hypothetical protein ACRDDZ_12930 [Marinifilaceae bacterium]